MYDTSHQPEAMRARYKYLPPAITELFEYESVAVVVDMCVEEFKLDDDQRAALLMEIELILYFFITRNGFVERLKESLEIDQGKATQIAAKVESELFVIVDGILDEAEVQFNASEADMADPVGESTPTPSIPPSADAAPPLVVTPPESIATVKPLRTFPEDLDLTQAHGYGAFRPEGNGPDADEPTHSSNQNDILGGRQ